MGSQCTSVWSRRLVDGSVLAKELSEKSRASPPGAGERSLNFQQEISVASVDVEPAGHESYDRSCQTDLKADDVGGGQGGGGPKQLMTKSSTSILMKMADRAKNRVERKKVESHPDYVAFFERATLLVERVLGQDTWDLALDFKNTSAEGVEGEGGGADALKHVDDYVEDKWSRGRRLDSKLLSVPVVSHSVEIPAQGLSGWVEAIPHKFDPALLYGGTYSGGIVLWDTRQKAGPVLKTPLSGKGHAHPVTAMEQVGTQNATNLVTASNDGRLCVWSLAMLNQPQETVDLKHESKGRREPSVMSLSFPENETNVNLRGTKTGITELYDGHDGPDLCLTSSFDWSIKLWRVKQFQSPVLSLDTFEDYVYDVRWHPTHPAVFASTDGEGHIDLWNLNKNIELPVLRCENPNGRRLALNKCHWSSDGRKLAAGDSEGTVSVFAADRTALSGTPRVVKTMKYLTDGFGIRRRSPGRDGERFGALAEAAPTHGFCETRDLMANALPADVAFSGPA
eukprot:s1104_g9.t1